MINKKDVLILIPARGGSTRVLNKNLRLLGDKPLCAYTILAAIDSGIGQVVVSTDSPEIAQQAKLFGAEVPFLRPADISTATASSVDVILHALRWYQEQELPIPKLVAFCPPTNPFRSAQTIREMVEKLVQRSDVNSIVTITKPATHPFRIIKQDSDGRCHNGIISIDGKTINDIERSQDWPIVWEGSPACRITRSQFFMDLKNSQGAKTYDVNNFLGYEISAIEATDIDNQEDFDNAQQRLKALGG